MTWCSSPSWRGHAALAGTGFAGLFEQAYVDAKGRDELGRLGRTFNVMVDVLRQREREHEREQRH